MEPIIAPVTRGQTEPREKLFDQLYEAAFPKVAAFVSKMNGSFEDAKDIFQDALVVFFEKRAEKDFTILVSEQAYILGIAKHLWARKFRHDRKIVTFDNSESEISIPADTTPDVNITRLLRLLETTGKKCMELLRAVYYDKPPMRNITHRLRYANEHSLSVQKYKCLEKVRDTVKNKSLAYEHFVN